MTPFGESWVHSIVTPAGGLAFLPRHGVGHTVAPHAVNHRANLAALKQLGVRDVLATCAVGSLSLTIEPGDLVLLDDFIDLTSVRTSVYRSSDPLADGPPVHTDFSTPYCPRVRAAVARELGLRRIPYRDGGVYVSTDGPRFETPAEIRMYRALGGDVIGMTGAPEAIVARELGLCYAGLAIVTNPGAGLSPERVDHRAVEARAAAAAAFVRDVLSEVALHISEVPRDCGC